MNRYVLEFVRDSLFCMYVHGCLGGRPFDSQSRVRSKKSTVFSLVSVVILMVTVRLFLSLSNMWPLSPLDIASTLSL